MPQVYLDNNATTPLDAGVLEEMLPCFTESYGNAASIHDYGQKARTLVEDARQEVANLIGAQPRDIIFTSGGTESDNTAIRGVAYAAGPGSHVITSTIEHPAVLRTCEQLEREGFRVTYAGVDQDGIVRVDEIRNAISAETILISIMHANNEVGSLQPLHEISRIAREHGVLLHTDAVQTVGKIPVDVGSIHVDLLSLSAHKLHGPKGAGALFIGPGVELQPFMMGGTHERGRRGGTENVPGIVGLGAACRLAGQHLDDFGTRVRSLRDQLENTLLEKVAGSTVNGSRERRMPHVSNISFEGVEGESLLIALDFQGIAVSTGAACSSGSLQPSHVLKALGLPGARIQGAIRFSLSRKLDVPDIDYVLEVLPQNIERMRGMNLKARA